MSCLATCCVPSGEPSSTIISSQSSLLLVDDQLVRMLEDDGTRYFFVNMSFRSHVMIGRLRRSLYVGRRTEYLLRVLMLGVYVRVETVCL